MVDEVGALWAEITDWLQRNAPVDAARIRPPASATLINEVQVAVGSTLPDDLRQWWHQADGVIHAAGAYLIPGSYAPMSCRDALDYRALQVQLEAESPIDDEALSNEECDDDEYWGFHPLYLPIGDDHCGNCLYVDLRDGPERGFVKHFDHEGGDPSGFCWRSVTEMLAELRDALIENKPGLLGKALRTLTGPEAFQACRATVTPEAELEWVPERLGPTQ